MTETDSTPSTLDRRREKMQTTKAAAGNTAASVESLDQQLESNATRRTGHEADLQATLDKVAGLKKSIKAAAKEHDRLRAARKDARRVATRMRHRADQAEARYDAAVLADMLRREKDHDLSVHNGAASDSTASDSSASEPTASEPTPAPTRPRSTRATTARTTASRTNSGGSTSSARRSSTTTRSRAAAADSTTKPGDAPNDASTSADS
jgi:hypothetical protein